MRLENRRRLGFDDGRSGPHPDLTNDCLRAGVSYSGLKRHARFF